MEGLKLSKFKLKTCKKSDKIETNWEKADIEVNKWMRWIFCVYRTFARVDPVVYHHYFANVIQ